MRENQTFGEMMKAALIPLANRDPRDIAMKTCFSYDEADACFRFSSLGTDFCLSWPGCVFTPDAQPWHALVILHYMNRARQALPANRLIPFGAQPGGMVRGGGFDRECEGIIRTRLGTMEPDALQAACEALGGRSLPSNADLCAVFDFLPRYPLTLKLWFADEEMEASGRVFLDAACADLLSVEDSVTVGTLLLEGLLNAKNNPGEKT